MLSFLLFFFEKEPRRSTKNFAVLPYGSSATLRASRARPSREKLDGGNAHVQIRGGPGWVAIWV